jgi:hypothetical protein
MFVVNVRPSSRIVLLAASVFVATLSAQNQPPTIRGVSPSSGNGSSLVVTGQYADPNGYGDLKTLELLFNTTSASFANACYMVFDTSTHLLYLSNDAGTSSIGSVAGGGGTIENSQCRVSIVSYSTYELVKYDLRISITFKGFLGAKNIYLRAADQAPVSSGFQQSGTWTVTQNQAPSVTSVAPNTAAGTAQTFTVTYSDPDGGVSLGSVQLLINNFLDGRSACYLAYNIGFDTLYLVKDDGDAGQPIGMLLRNGSGGALSNSQCTVTWAGSSAVFNGNQLVLTLAVTFSSSAFHGNKVLYSATQDNVGNNTGWVTMGVYGVTGGPITYPAAIAVQPSYGTTSTQSLTFTYDDATNYQNLSSVQALVNTALDGRVACYVAYSLVFQTLYLVPDNGDAAHPINMPLNGSGSLSNSQCTITGAGSSVSGSGKRLTLILNMTFKPAFAGRRIIWTATQNLSNGNSDWQALGGWSIP